MGVTFLKKVLSGRVSWACAQQGRPGGADERWVDASTCSKITKLNDAQVKRLQGGDVTVADPEGFVDLLELDHRDVGAGDGRIA